MEFTTLSGTLFVIPDMEKKSFKETSPCDFLAMLLRANRGLAWETFSRENIIEVIDAAVKGFPHLAKNLSPPFNFDHRIFKVSKDWQHIEKVLQYPLPALPSPTVVKMPRDADSLVYQQAGRSYRLPQANDFIFTAKGLDFNHFLTIWVHLNKRNMEVISVKEVQAALRNLALEGFPDAHKLTKYLFKLFDSSDERKMMQQHWAKVWLDLKINRPKESLGIAALKTQALGTGPVTASYEPPGQLGSVNSIAHRNRTPKTYTMSKLQLELLRSENRFISITTLVPKPRNQAAFVKAELDAVSDVQQRSGPGLLGAIWYGRQLIVEFATCAQRDRALRTMTRGSSTLVKENVHPIGSGEGGGARLYMSWLLPFYREDTPATLSSALEDHFDGTGYSSFFTFGQFDRPEGYIRIIFHNAPPALKTILKSHCFRERSFFLDAVTNSDFPLQKPSFMQREIKANADAGVAEEIANDTDKESMELALETSGKEATYSLQTEQEHNKSESTVPQTIHAKTEVNVDVEAAEGPANDTDKRVEASPAEDPAKETEVNTDVDAIEKQANDSDNEAEASAAADGDIDTGLNANVDIAGNHTNDTGKRVEVARADNSVAEIRKPSHFEDESPGDDNAISDEQAQAAEEEVRDDHGATKEASTTVTVDGTAYKIPTACALPLHQVSFNKFAQMYLQMEPQESKKMNSKTLLKLYRTFLDSQFPDSKGDPVIEAFQRLDFEEALINTRPGGLSYPFYIDSPYVYRKGLLVKPEKPQATPTALASAKPTFGDKMLAQPSEPPSLDRGTSNHTADQLAGSERKRATRKTPSRPSFSSTSIKLAPSAPKQQKLHKSDMLSALERYLDDLDARLQLEQGKDAGS